MRDRSGSPRRFSVLALLLSALLVATGLTVLATTPANAAIDPCGAGGNKISCENSKPGTDIDLWDVSGAGSTSIQGFATDISVNVGSPISFKVDTAASAYNITIYRTGWYNGDGARQIATVTPSARLPQTQPACLKDPSTELTDCGNWGVSATWNVPSTAVSGVYVALLTVPSTGARSHIVFIVRDDSSHSDVVFQTSDPTWQAYNTYGGSDFYQGAANGRAYKVSYNRPVLTRGDNGGRDFYFSNEFPAVEFLEQNGYDVSYIAGVDTDRRGALLKNHKVFLSVGHDEYWSGAQRANVEAARDAGVNLQFLSGNEVYWRTRYEPSADSSHTAYRTLVCYKETWANTKSDPADESTATWRDPRFTPASKGGGKPENALTGTAYMSNFSDLALTVTGTEGKFRIWRNTSLTSMSPGQSTALSGGTIGYESDEDLDNGFRPAGLIRMSTTTGSVPQYLQDFGNVTAPGTTTHHITMYKAPSGALVFGAGTIQWSWGLNDQHDRGGATADPRMQQAQVNLLADMGAQPTTLMSGLVAATKSTDTTAPTVSISAPAAGSTQNNGARVTVSGTASDSGGVVAGVEVSTDGGQNWHAATGTTSWSYTFDQKGVGGVSVQARAMDDSANIGQAATRSYNAKCPCNIFGTTAPTTASVDDGNAAELGLRFTPAGDGTVTGVRFYKGSTNTGTHTGTLWSSAGQKLASVTFTGETASGWQTASFATPVSVAAGQTYVVSYTAPSGHYAAQSWAFSAAPYDAGALYVSGGFGAQPAGVFGTPGSYPGTSFQNTNYFVDPVFVTDSASPLIATNETPMPDSSSVPTNTTVSAQFLKSVVSGSASLTLKDAAGAKVTGTTSYDATSRTVTFTPSAPLSGFVKYTATVDAVDAQGNHPSAGNTWSFTTAKPPNAPGVCPCTLFDDTTVPTVLDATDGSPLTLGVRFTSSKAGQITGVRFYKAPGHGGTHTGTLWNANGAVLATGTFTNESSSGWQTLTFDQPVNIDANTQYVAGYYAAGGIFSMTPNQFSTTNLSRAPLNVTSSSGAYLYGNGFPTGTSANNYLVDPVFELAKPTIAIASQDPAPGAVDVARGSNVTVRLTAAVAPGYSLTVSSGGSQVAGSTALSSDGTKLTFTPAQPFAKDVDVTVDLSGVTSTEGANLPAQRWTFHTNGDDATAPPESLFGDLVPSVQAAADGAPVELGTAFTPAADGTIKSIRFFKGAGNGGTHTGSIWSSTGTRLATVTFTNETATGWQTAKLATPLPVKEGTQYVVSYLAPQGHYSTTPGFFASPYTSGNLTAPASGNGRYVYGGGFPSNSFNATNYFVDVVYVMSAPSISVADRSPAPGATDVNVGAKPSVTFSTTVASNGWTMTAARGSTPVAGTADLSADGRTLTFTPSSPLPADADITVTVSGVVSTKGAQLPTDTWTFHTETSASSTVSMLTGVTPASTSANDSAGVELGMAFTPSVAGSVTAIKFYKGAGNTGTHRGSIWTSSGTRLATVTFTDETASGWQSAKLDTPLPLTAGQTYVVSYFAPNGHYSTTPSYFSTSRTSGPLTAPTTNNGRYLYTGAGGFPTNSWNATNYFVDLDFRYASP